MASQKIPYPPPPADIPEGLTDYADSFVKQQSLLLAGLFVFLIFYIFMVVLFGMLALWCMLTFSSATVLKIIGLVLSLTFFLFLVKGFFKNPGASKDMHVEITEDEQPLLFSFINQLCDEIDAPLPNRVYLAPDVNAACMSRTSLVNLFVEPKRDLLIGLGLVNCMNLSEFKAVLAHEFGHFCHLGKTSSYAVVVKRIIFDLVEGEDWFDRLIIWCKRQESAVGAFGYAIGGCLWVGRKVLWWMLKTIALQDRVVSREQEFHADRVAVSAAGSDAATHGLLRARFGFQCFMQAIDDLATALDHKLYTNNLYLHQDRAAAVVRRKKKDYTLGLPPELPTLNSGAKIKVFDAEQDEIEDQDDTPPMWRTHPADADREENAKDPFVAASQDHRSPWILFSDVPELKERLTYKFYRVQLRISKSTELTEAQKVQEYIDNEHAETTYDPKYYGAYDDRPIEPGDLSELNTAIEDSPWDEERMEKVYDKLFDGCKAHAEAHAELHKEMYALEERVVGKPSSKLKKQIEAQQEKLDENWEWFKAFDRRVYLLHIQMAAEVDPQLKQELIERYRFQLEVQRLYKESRFNYNKANAYLNALFNADPNNPPPPDFGAEVISVLRKAWKSLKTMIQDAREINLPAMKNFAEGDRLADFILEGKLVPEPPLSGVKGVWIDKLMTQLNRVRNRCFRLHFKSVGGILALQEKIAAAWVAARVPVASEVADFVAESDDVLAAEIVDAEPARIYTSLDEVRVESLTRGPNGKPYPLDDGEAVFEIVDGEVVAEPAGLMDGPMSLDDIRVESVGSPGVFTAAPMAAFKAHPTAPRTATPAPPVAPPAARPVAPPVAPQVARPVEQPNPFAFGSSAPQEPAEVVFSLVADPIAMPAAEPIEEVFSLDASEPVPVMPPAPAAPVVAPVASVAAPIAPLETITVPPVLNGMKRVVEKPAEGRRPALKITFVLPGEKAPFEK